MKIGICADLHFGRGGEAGLGQHRKSFREMIRGMISEEVELCIVVGDVFEKYHHFSAPIFSILAAGFGLLNAQGVQTIIVAGNHDYDRSGLSCAVEPLAEIDGVLVFTTPANAMINKTSLVLIPWLTKSHAVEADIDLGRPNDEINFELVKKYVEPALDSAPGGAVCVFHASVFGGDMGAAVCASGIDFTLHPDWLTGREFAHIIGGHFHRRQVIAHAGEEIIYVGSMERNTFGERDNPTGWLLLDGTAARFVELKTTKRFTEYSEDFTIPGAFEAFMAADRNIRGHAVKIKYRIAREMPFDRAALIDRIEEQGATPTPILEAEYTDTEQARTDIRAGDDMMSQFMAWREVNRDKDADNRLLEILRRELKTGFPIETTDEHLELMMDSGVELK